MNFYFWLAYIIPKKLVYWCLIRAICIATTGEYKKTDASTITAMEVLKRFE